MKNKEVVYGWIYCFEIGGKKYIGQTPFLKQRFKAHFKDKKYNTFFHNFLRKHFSKNGSFKIIECWKRNGRSLEEFKKLLGSREVFWTEKLDTYDPEQKKGWNLTKGGTGSLGLKHDSEIRKKISEVRKKHSPWNKGKICPQLSKKRETPPWNKGKICPTISSAHFGKELTLEHRKNISKGMKSKHTSNKTR